MHEMSDLRVWKSIEAETIEKGKPLPIFEQETPWTYLCNRQSIAKLGPSGSLSPLKRANVRGTSNVLCKSRTCMMHRYHGTNEIRLRVSVPPP
jgi:hypothetical protein